MRPGWREAGDSLPPATASAVTQADAVLLGAVGHPSLAAAEGRRRPEAGLLALRKLLGAYANLRPVAVHPALAPRLAAPARAAGGGGSAHRARAARRAVLRPAARARARQGGQHHALLGRRDRAGGPGGVRGGPGAAQVGDVGGQGERAGGVPALAGDGDPGRGGLPGRAARAPLRGLRGDAAGRPSRGHRRAAHREPVRRHPERRGGGADRLARAAAVGVDRRRAGAVRAGARLGARHRREGHRQPARRHRLGGDAPALWVEAAGGGRRRGPGGRRGAVGRAAHARHRPPGRGQRRHPGDRRAGGGAGAMGRGAGREGRRERRGRRVAWAAAVTPSTSVRSPSPSSASTSPSPAPVRHPERSEGACRRSSSHSWTRSLAPLGMPVPAVPSLRPLRHPRRPARSHHQIHIAAQPVPSRSPPATSVGQ